MFYFYSVIQKQNTNLFNLLCYFGLWVGMLTLFKICTMKYRIPLSYKILKIIDISLEKIIHF